MYKGFRHSEESRRKMSESHKGVPLSKETCSKIAEAQRRRKGEKRSPEACENISKSKRGENNPNYGKHLSEELKNKIRSTNIRTWSDPELRKRQSELAKCYPLSESAHANLVKSHQTDEFKAKISRAQKGIPETQEAILSLRESHQTPEFRKKMSDSYTPERKEKLSKQMQGDKNHNFGKTREKSSMWKGGISFGPYCPLFNYQFKEHIRDKFNRVCFICDKLEEECVTKLCVHHIDYNKNSVCNGKEWAFVPLCKSCHSKTNSNRWYWFNLLINYWAMNKDIMFEEFS